MVILTHHTGEPHGILGAQVAATFFQQKLSIPSIVVGIERNFLKERLLRFIDEYYAGKEKVAAFSHLCGRKDIIELAQELKRRVLLLFWEDLSPARIMSASQILTCTHTGSGG